MSKIQQIINDHFPNAVVFPLTSKKSPAVNKGESWKTYDKPLPKDCKAYGISVGSIGAVVIDIDRHHLIGDDGVVVDGVAEFKKFVKENGGFIPDTFTVATASGGMHLYFKLPKGVELGNTTGDLPPSIDVRGGSGNKGYVMGPGSVALKKIDGQLSNEYGEHIIVKDLPMAEIPTWLVLKLLPSGAPSAPATPAAPVDYSLLSNELKTWERSAIEEASERVRALGPGKRNESMRDEAYKLGAKLGAHRFNDVVPVLVAAGIACGHDQNKVNDTVPRAFEAGSVKFTPRESQTNTGSASDYRSPLASGARRNVTEEKDKKSVLTEKDFATATILKAIDKVKVLDAATDLAKNLSSSAVPDSLWKQSLSAQLSELRDNRKNAPKFTKEQIDEAIELGVKKSNTAFASTHTWLVPDKRSELKKVEDDLGDDMTDVDYYYAKPMAVRFLKQHGHLVRYDNVLETFITKDEATNTWSMSSPAYLIARFTTKEYAKAEATDRFEIIESARHCQTGVLDKGIETALRSMPEIFKRFKTFDDAPDYINTPAGVIDLRNSENLGYSKEFYFTKVTRVSWVEPTKRGQYLWSKILEAHPDERHEFMQLVEGNALTGHKDASHRVYFGSADGNNGKSMYDELIFELLGGDEDTSFSVLMDSDVLVGNTTEFTLWPMRGRRRISIHETDQSRDLNTEALKRISGTNSIRAASKGVDSISFKNCGTTFFYTNHEAFVRQQDYGTRRRLCFLDFPYTFGEDMPLVEGIDDFTRNDREVQEAAFNWMIEGARKWYDLPRGKVPETETIRKATDEWVYRGDRIRALINDLLILDPTEPSVEWLDALPANQIGYKIRLDDFKDAAKRWYGGNNYGGLGYDNFMMQFMKHALIVPGGKAGVIKQTDGRTDKWIHSAWFDQDKQEAVNRSARYDSTGNLIASAPAYAPRPTTNRGTNYIVGLRFRTHEDTTPAEAAQIENGEVLVPDSVEGFGLDTDASSRRDVTEADIDAAADSLDDGDTDLFI
jgi:hypothetical protein